MSLMLSGSTATEDDTSSLGVCANRGRRPSGRSGDAPLFSREVGCRVMETDALAPDFRAGIP